MYNLRSHNARAVPRNCPAFLVPDLPVHHFDWARTILQVSVSGLRVLSTTFFDDVPTAGTDSERVQLTSCVEALFSVTLCGLKDMDSFAPSFSAFGVQVDLGEFDAGKAAFGNRNIRFSGLTGPIGEDLAQGSIEPLVARKLRGRFLFASSNLFCRVGAGALRQLGNVADAVDPSPTGVQSALSGLRELCSLLDHLRPRLVRPTRPLFSLLFADGAYEDGARSLGGVILDDKKGIAAIGLSVDEHLWKFWTRREEKQLIGLLEVLPVLVAKMVLQISSLVRLRVASSTVRVLVRT